MNENSNIHVICNIHTEVNWKGIPDRLMFESDLVYIFNIHIPGLKGNISILEKYLSDEELLISGKYRKIEDKESYIISKGILKILIGKLIKVDPQEIHIGVGVNNKPILTGHHNLRFNISHSHERIMIILSDKEVGIDIEKIVKEFNYDEIIEMSFSENERVHINNSLSRSLSFFELWTRKEALAKATSKGIDDDFHLIPSLIGDHEVSTNIVGSNVNWNVSTVAIDPDYVCSFAYKSDPTTIMHFYSTDSGLMNL